MTGRGIESGTDIQLNRLSDSYKREAADYLEKKPSLADKVMDWIRDHRRETSWAVIGATIMTPVVASATESGYIESGEIKDGLSDMGIKLSASSETSNPSTLSPPEVTVTPTNENENSTPAPGYPPESNITPGPGEIMSEEELAVMSALENLGWSTDHYEYVQEKIDEYKEILKNNECQEINLEACAHWLFARNESHGFMDQALFIYPEKTIMSNYVTDEQIIEFGKTGKGLNVIYLNEQGNNTKKPFLLCVFNSENKVAKVSDIETCVDWWEGKVPGFSNFLDSNNTWVFFQSQAGKDDSIHIFNFGDTIIYYNYSDDNFSGFRSSLIMALGKEPFGIRGDFLGGKLGVVEIGLIKARLALDCCKYIFVKTGDQQISNLIRSYEREIDSYTKKYRPDGNIDDILALIKEIKANNLIAPYGADSWEEIDAALADEELKANGN